MSTPTSVATTTQSEFRAELADAYARAALAGADMFKTVPALEAIRSVLVDRRTGLRALDALDDQVALADNDSLRAVLTELRLEIKRALFEEQRVQLEDLAATDPKAAASEWMQAYGAALRYWRTDVCANLAGIPIELGDGMPSHDQMAYWTKLIVHERFAETLEGFLALGHHSEYPADWRSRFLVNAAQVHLYHLYDYPPALELVHEAEELAADDPVVVMALGEYRLETGDVGAAKERFQQALSTDEAAEACRLMGDACVAAGDLDEAERWFIQAIGYRPGQPSSYMRLASVYGRRGGLAPGDVRLQSLVQRAVAGDASSEYSVFVTIGGVHADAGDTEAAMDWYRRAVEIDPTRIRGHVAEGNLLTGVGRFDEAEQAFLRAVEHAPEAFEGYWGLGWTYESAGRLEKALERYRESLERRPSWRDVVAARMAATLRGLGRLDEAEELLLGEIATGQDGTAALAELHVLVDELHRARGDADGARALLGRIRELKGDPYEGNYWNRLGNLDFALGDYWSAAECYRRSLAADASDAVVHRNLATAYREVRDWNLAREEIEAARELDHNDAEYRRMLALLLNAQGNAFIESEDYEAARERYEGALELSPDDDVIHTNLAIAWMGIWRPGERRQALEAALASVARARELEPAREDLDESDRSIGFELALLDRLGEPPSVPDAGPRTIAVELAPDLVPLIAADYSSDLITEAQAVTTGFRDRIRATMDLTPPGIRFAENESLAASTYELLLLEWPLGRGLVEPACLLFRGESAVLADHGVEPRGRFAEGDEPAWWVAEDEAERLRADGVELLPPVGAMMLHLETVLRELLKRS